jgi:hypothetical protein
VFFRVCIGASPRARTAYIFAVVLSFSGSKMRCVQRRGSSTSSTPKATAQHKRVIHTKLVFAIRQGMPGRGTTAIKCIDRCSDPEIFSCLASPERSQKRVHEHPPAAHELHDPVIGPPFWEFLQRDHGASRPAGHFLRKRRRSHGDV